MRSSDAKSYQEGFAARAERELPASGDWRILVAMRIKLEQTPAPTRNARAASAIPAYARWSSLAGTS
jgi:hypothetical protein